MGIRVGVAIFEMGGLCVGTGTLEIGRNGAEEELTSLEKSCSRLLHYYHLLAYYVTILR